LACFNIRNTPYIATALRTRTAYSEFGAAYKYLDSTQLNTWHTYHVSFSKCDDNDDDDG